MFIFCSKNYFYLSIKNLKNSIIFSLGLFFFIYFILIPTGIIVGSVFPGFQPLIMKHLGCLLARKVNTPVCLDMFTLHYMYIGLIVCI